MLSDNALPAPARRVDARSSIARILDAARVAFARPRETTLKTIASEAGVGIATLYRHFPNREALTTAVLERVLQEELRPLIARLGDETATREELLDVAETFSAVLAREPALTQSVDSAAAVIVQYLGENDEFRAWVARAQAAGNIRPDLDPADAPVILALITTQPALLGAGAERRRYLSLLLDGLNPVRATALPDRAEIEGESQ